MNAVWLAVLLLSDIVIDLECPDQAGPQPALIRSAIAFRPGELARAGDAAVLDAAGVFIPADLVAVLAWEDGSVRVLTLCAAAKGRRAAERIRVRCGQARHGAPGVEFRQQDGGVTIDTGALSAALSGTAEGFLTDVRCAGRKVAGLGEGLHLAIRLNGEAYAPGPAGLSFEHGNARCRATFRGVMYGAEGRAGPGYALRLTFTAGSAAIGCRVALDGGALSAFCEGVELKLRPPWTSSNAPICFYTGGPPTTLAPATGGAVQLWARATRVELAWAGESTFLPKGPHARVILKGSAPDLVLDFPDFGYLHPWGVSIVPGGAVTISLLNEGFDWEPCFAFRRDFVLGVGAAAPGLEGRLRNSGAGGGPESLEEDFRLPPLERRELIPGAPVAVDLDEEPLAALYFEVTRALVDRLADEWKRWDGMMNYGDYRKSHGIWANQEYDIAFGMLRRFLMGGDSRDFAMARRALDHWLCYDRAGRDDPSAPEGTPWVHGSNHRSCRIEPGHMWLQGLLLYFWLTGESEHRHAALSVGDCLEAALPQLAATKSERSLSWALIAFAALVEAGYERFRPAMDQTAAILRSRQAACGLIALREARVGDAACVAANTWVTGGITVDALFRHHVLTEDRRSLESAVSAARAVLDTGLEIETGRYFQQVFFDAGTGAILERTGRVDKGKTVLLSLAAARAYELTGDEAFRRRAHELLERGLSELRRSMPDFPGEDLAMVLRAAPDVLAVSRK